MQLARLPELRSAWQFAASMLGSQEPLSRHERTALIRILSASARDHAALAPRQRAALDAYAHIVNSPPLIQADVISAARAMIKIWAEIGASERRSAKRRIIPAELLDLEDVLVEPELDSRATEMMAPVSPLSPLIADLIDPWAPPVPPESERATEVLEPITPDWVSSAGRVHPPLGRP